MDGTDQQIASDRAGTTYASGIGTSRSACLSSGRH
jgi:hypothetical protein